MDATTIHELGVRFQQLLHEKRQQTNAFSRELMGLSHTPLLYENESTLDAALEVIPLELIYASAEEEEAKVTEYGYQDHVIRALLKWFKRDFFKWINEPPCSNGHATTLSGMTVANATEVAEGSSRVEIYTCSTCGETRRFPRYNNPAVLLRTREGRCGEWANCFTMLCRAMGSRVRWVWNSEDHVWTEVWSDKCQRWIHCDACETAFDEPNIYARGWGKKMAYVIVFSTDGAMDVTRRYVRSQDHSLPRTKASEETVKRALAAVSSLRRRAFSVDDQRRLQRQDEAEGKELASYRTVNESPLTTHESQPRQTGTAEWKAARGEDGSH